MVGQSTPKTPCSRLSVWPRNSVAVVAYSTILQNSNTAMQTASHVSLHLIRFESLRPAGAIEVGDRAGVLFCGVAADTRAAGTEPASQQAFAFAILGLHQDAVSAHWLLENYRSVAPWTVEAREVWGAVLRPFRHKGEANYLNRMHPGPLFEPGALFAAPSADTPFVSITTSGWHICPELDMNRVREFSTGVLAVRASMTAMSGLHSQQSFFFPRGLEHDPMTITFWKNQAALTEFAYGPGGHRLQMERQHERGLADRTSFTRCLAESKQGTWYGACPLA